MATTEIAKQTNTLDNSFMAVIERAASNPDVDIAKMQQLLDMQERILTKQGEISFNQAMARLQPQMPVIKRGKKADKSYYARYEDIDPVIRPLYTAEGFSLSFTSKREGDVVTYYGTLHHVDGHKVTAEIDLPADKSGSKNDIQAKASTMTYAKRYLLTMLLNVVTADEDDDGHKGGTKTIETAKAAELDNRIRKLKDAKEYLPKFLSYMKVGAILEIPQRDLQKAETALKAKEAEASK